MLEFIQYSFIFLICKLKFGQRLTISVQITNLIIDMQKKQGNIRVFCRFRPFNKHELDNKSTKLHRISNNKQLIIKDPKLQKAEEISFMYDHVFDVNSTQQEVYQQVGLPVLQNILDGFNGCIMAYGQTSSGKTHTMQGYDLNDKQLKGIMPRIIEKLFLSIQKSTQSVQYKLKISIFQLYMEKIRDLLDVTKNDLKIRQNKLGSYIQNITEVYIGDKAELFKLIHIGQKNRITCATNMNEHSSRSHMIFLLSINQFNNVQSSSKTSKLFLIDLAGSQKVSKTGAEGKVLQQAKKINLSLTNLGKVIKHLSEKHSHIPYRDSKLTRVLKDSLGGNSKTTLIVTCSPHQMHLPQTISTLRFGQNAQKVKNKPKINRQLTVQQLQKMIQKMQEQVRKKDQKLRIIQKYLKDVLKVQIPQQFIKQVKSSIKDAIQTTQNSQVASQQIIQQFNQPQLEQKIQNNEESIYQNELIKQLEQQITSYKTNMQVQMQKYYQLKKQYNQLHQNLTSILTQNIQLQEEKNKLSNLNMQNQQKLVKTHENIIQDKLIQNNSILIKMIIGQIFSIIGPYQQQEIVKIIQNDHWYKCIMKDGINCTDYWEIEKEKMSKQIQEFTKQKNYLRQSSDKKQSRNQAQRDKQNQKIMMLENKLDKLFQQYHQMISLQTTWKAQCQLYERKLKKKQQKIQQLQQMLHDLQQQIQFLECMNDEIDDTRSVKSKIVKPLKGGSFNFKK